MLQNVTGEIGGKTKQDKNRPQTDRKKGGNGPGKAGYPQRVTKSERFSAGPGGGIGCAGAAIRDACKSGCPVLAGWGGLHAAGRGHWVRRAGVHSMAA